MLLLASHYPSYIYYMQLFSYPIPTNPRTIMMTHNKYQTPMLIACCSFLTWLLLASSTSARASSCNISSLVSREQFRSIFLHKDDAACPASGFFTYDSFVEACKSFPRFANTGSLPTRKRELAAFLAQISHETTGGWATAPDGPFSWGLCFKEEISRASIYCDANNTRWPCVPGKSYHGRGPIQLSWNFNYGPAGRALGFDGLQNPETVAENSLISWRTALWFWMTDQQSRGLSCHNVMIGRYVLTRQDRAANRTLGFGLVTNIINGGLECGIPTDGRVLDRIGYFQRYASIFNVTTGPNLECQDQQPFV